MSDDIPPTTPIKPKIPPEVLKRLEQVEVDKVVLEVENASLKKLNISLQERINVLEAENNTLNRRLAAESFKLKTKPSSLIESIQADLLKVDEFALKQKGNTTYIVSDLNMQLKSVITREGDNIVLVLPSTQEGIKPDLLSTLNISIKPIPLPYKEEYEPSKGIGIPLSSLVRSDLLKIMNVKGINTIQDLARASPDTLTEIGIEKREANKVIDKARLIAKTEFAGLVEDQIADLLIIANIDSKEVLSKSNAEELFKTLNNIIKKDRRFKRVTLTLDNINELIKEAQRS